MLTNTVAHHYAHSRYYYTSILSFPVAHAYYATYVTTDMFDHFLDFNRNQHCAHTYYYKWCAIVLLWIVVGSGAMVTSNLLLVSWSVPFMATVPFMAIVPVIRTELKVQNESSAQPPND